MVLGVLEAHALRARLSPDMLNVFEIGVRYQFYHVFATFAAAWAFARWQRRVLGVAGWLFLGGIVLFCGSLYVISLTGERWIGAVTPIGGFAFLAGWLCLALGAWSARKSA